MFDFFIKNPNTTILLLLIIILIQFILVIIALITSASGKKRWRNFTEGINVKNVEELLESNAKRITELEEKSDEIKKELRNLDIGLSFAVQNVGMVKYDAFDNVGNHLSFSLALLDSYKNGVVITSIYGRDFTTLYGKPVRLGKSEYPMSEEEMEALDRAVKGVDKPKIK